MTFNKRNTSVENIKIIDGNELKKNESNQKQWKGFLKKIKSEMSEDFINIIDKLESFIEPIFEKVIKIYIGKNQIGIGKSKNKKYLILILHRFILKMSK